MRCSCDSFPDLTVRFLECMRACMPIGVINAAERCNSRKTEESWSRSIITELLLVIFPGLVEAGHHFHATAPSRAALIDSFRAHPVASYLVGAVKLTCQGYQLNHDASTCFDATAVLQLMNYTSTSNGTLIVNAVVHVLLGCETVEKLAACMRHP